MKDLTLTYFEDVDNGYLLAYEKSSEFFVRYIPQINEWEDCNISFSNFKHDYYFREVSKEDAERITNGNLPEGLFRQYLDVIRKNLGGI